MQPSLCQQLAFLVSELRQTLLKILTLLKGCAAKSMSIGLHPPGPTPLLSKPPLLKLTVGQDKQKIPKRTINTVHKGLGSLAWDQNKHLIAIVSCCLQVLGDSNDKNARR